MPKQTYSKDITDKDVKNLKAAIDTAKHKGKGGRPYSKSNGTGKSQSRGPKGNSRGHNDISFWNQFPELLNQAGNIAFNNIAGEAEVMEQSGEIVAPGTVRIDYLQTVGKASKWSDPVNLQMKALWLDLHRKYRGVGSYESADLAMGMFAICDFFAQIAEAERIYGTYVKYSTLNRNEPRTLLMAEGAPLQVTGIELSDYRASLNLLIAAANTLCLPKGIKLFNILIERCSGIYQDSDSPKASRYLFRTPYWVRYESKLYTTGTALTYQYKPTVIYSNSKDHYDYEPLQDIITRLRGQLDALLNDSDVQRMCSDLLACYGNEAVFSLDYLAENASVEVVKFDEITLQFHNMRTAGSASNLIDSHVPIIINSDGNYDDSELHVYQVDNVVHFDIAQKLSNNTVKLNLGGIGGDYVTVSDAAAYLNSTILPIRGSLVDTWNVNQPNVDEVTEMTRLVVGTQINTVINSSLTSGNGAYSELYHGIFIPLEVSIYTNASDLNPNLTTHHLRQASLQSFADITPTHILLMRRLSVDNRYDWFPFYYIGNWKDWTKMSSTPKVDDLVKHNLEWYPMGDVVNMKFINFNNLEKLHDACVMSAWKVSPTTFSIQA